MSPQLPQKLPVRAISFSVNRDLNAQAQKPLSASPCHLEKQESELRSNKGPERGPPGPAGSGMSGPGSQAPGPTRGPAHLPRQLRSAPAGPRRGNAPAGRQAAVRTSCAVPSLPARRSSGAAAAPPSPGNRSRGAWGGRARTAGSRERRGWGLASRTLGRAGFAALTRRHRDILSWGFEARRTEPPPLLRGPGCPPRHPSVLFLTRRPRGAPGPASPRRGN